MRTRYNPFNFCSMCAKPGEEEIDVIDGVPEDVLILLSGLFGEEVEEGTVEFQHQLYRLSPPLSFVDGCEEGPAGMGDCSAN